MIRFVFFLLLIPFAAWADDCRPLIGVSGQEASSRTVIPIITVLRTLGADTLYLGPQKDRDVARDMARIDGLIVAGNSDDIDPARYGQPLDPRTNLEKEPYRGEYEYAAIERALNSKMPLLGICGGMQRMVVSGDAEVRGSLLQHVDGQNQGKTKPPVPPYVATERIALHEGTWLRALLGNDSVKVNSYHHQVPQTLRQGFRVSAMSQHGTIEAMEPLPGGPYAGQFAVGVMWHPEFSADALSRKLMKAFVDEARSRRCH